MNDRKWITPLAAAVGFAVLILDSRTGLLAARDGIALCAGTLIPSMFPFFVLSMVLTSSLAGKPIKALRPLGKLCRIPSGAESLLAIGLLGGYPVGAQNVLSAHRQGALSETDAMRMAVFCNNAGPAFLFGYLGSLFDDAIYPWIIWGIHITSALILGWVLPGGTENTSRTAASPPLSLSQALNRSIRVMAQVCGWVVLFRVLIGFLDRWLFWAVGDVPKSILAGFLELSNGCILLASLPSNGMRMVLASTILGFGGLCVLLQTHSIAGSFNIPMYLPGKVFQGCISFLLAWLVQFFLPDAEALPISPFIPGVMGLCALFFLFLLRKQEKPVAFFDDLLYNQASCEKRRSICSSGKKSKNPAPTALSAQS